MTAPASAPSGGANASAAATFADRLVRALADLGVQHAVVSPGSRSQALALALAELETEGVLQLHVRIDERVGAFTALGIARETGVPALVVTTSGTAAANLLPAVVEASHSGVPMIVLTADRPEHLRGTGSNQTTYQPGLFGRFARWEADVPAPTLESIPDARRLAADAVAVSTGPDRGPVHLNLQFVEPLSGALLADDTGTAGSVVDTIADPPAERGAGAGVDPSATLGAGVDSAAKDRGATSSAACTGTAAERRTRHLPRGPRTLVVAGADAGERAQEIAAEAGWPLVAEVSSGSRFGPLLAQHHRELLDHPDFGGRVERVVVFGHPTLSRQVAALLGRDRLDLTVVAGPGEPVVPHPDAVLVDEVTVDLEDRADRAARAWTVQWVFAGRDLAEAAAAEDDVAPPVIVQGGSEDIEGSRAYAKGELAALNAPVTRRALVLAVWRATWPHDRLVLGASRLIRELDATAPGKRIAVHANRGLAGIDGTVATATGIAIASQSIGTQAGADGDAAGTGAARISAARTSAAGTSTAHVGTARDGTAGTSTAGTSTAGTSTAQTGMAPTGTARTGTAPTGTAQTGTARTGTARSSTARTSTARTGTTRVLLGDLTLLHDAGALLLPPGETAPRLQLVVGNDGGGSIFDGLEVAGTAAPDAFDRVLFTPQQVDLAALAAAYGWTHRIITRRGDLDSALSSPPPGRSIIEVRLAR